MNIDSVSIVIPVTERGDDLIDVYNSYHENISKLGIKYEFLIVLVPRFQSLAEELTKENYNDSELKVILLNRNYGEAGLLNIGVEHSNYNYILTLPPYEQVSASAIPVIMNKLDDNDAIVVNRWPRVDSSINKIQSSLFRGLLKLLSYNAPKDAGCGVRFFRKDVFDDLKLYGDLHRFFLILADQAGFKTAEIDMPQSKSDSHRRIYSVKTYLSRLLDILTVVFLTRFNKKPLRFFGTIGAFSALFGFLGLGYIGVERIFYDVAAADRPLLVLFSLFLVLGVQLIAIGLVGETIIFTSSKNNKEYRIKRIIN
jgi:glycosyltransferase involved in cell wall biosynthesis